MFKRRHVDVLLPALELVLRRMTAQLVLIGTFPPGENERIKALMQNPAIKDHVLHFEFVSDEDLNLFYNAAAMLVYPSIYEGFGLPVLEAMRCGTPVLVSRFASLPEVAGDAGIFIDPWDPVNIADKVCYLLADSSVRANMIEKGLAQAESFSWSRCARITIDILRLAGAPKMRAVFRHFIGSGGNYRSWWARQSARDFLCVFPCRCEIRAFAHIRLRKLFHG